MRKQTNKKLHRMFLMILDLKDTLWPFKSRSSAMSFMEWVAHMDLYVSDPHLVNSPPVGMPSVLL